MRTTAAAARRARRLVVVYVTSFAAMLASTLAYADGIDVSHWQGTINWSKVKAAGMQFNRNPDKPELPDAVEVTAMLQVCEHVALFADAARRAGINPTRKSFLEAVGNTGRWSHRVTGSPPLTLTPKRYDSVDNYAVVRWQSRCNGPDGCYRRVEGFRPGQ